MSPVFPAGVKIFKSFFLLLESEETVTASVLPRQLARLALPHPATLVNDFLLSASLTCLAFILPILLSSILFYLILISTRVKMRTI